MTTPSARRLSLAAAALLTVGTMAGCGSSKSTSTPDASASSAGTGPVAINAGEKSCDVAQTTLTAGRHRFEVTNTASQVTEVYVYAAGDRIVGEVENVGPSTKRTLIVDLTAGSYQVACKPGMVGNGIRTALSISGASAAAQTLSQNLTAAVAGYRTYVDTEARALLATTKTFTDAVQAGDLTRARASYPSARLHYERIEPIAESFGDLDPLIDMRIDDVTAGTPFVGFHALEQLLFQRNTVQGGKPLSAALLVNVTKLEKLVKTVQLTPLVMANGAKSLLDEVAKSKVTGEEERYSRMDLVDFAGNVDGAKYVYTALRPAIMDKDPDLARTLDQRFTALVQLLDSHRGKPGDRGYINNSPYVSYDVLTNDQVKALAIEVDAISEPLGQLAGAVSST